MLTHVSFNVNVLIFHVTKTSSWKTNTAAKDNTNWFFFFVITKNRFQGPELFNSLRIEIQNAWSIAVLVVFTSKLPGRSALRRRNLKTQVLLWKRSNVFRPHYAVGIYKRNNHRSFWIRVRRKTRSGKSPDYRHAIVVKKLHFQNVFRPHENGKPEFSNFSSW